MRKTLIATTTASLLVLAGVGSALGHGAERPSHIHAGACPAPGDVVAALENTVSVPGEAAGPESAIPVEVGTSTVEIPLDDIVAGGHAIVVHHDPEDMATYLVCGDIGGVVGEDGSLAVGLGPVGESSRFGTGVLTDNGDGTTSVVVYLANPGAVAAEEG